MKISILLPYKENFSPIYAGAVSLFVKDTTKISKFKDKFVFGTGTNSLNENIQLMKHCINNGIDNKGINTKTHQLANQ